MKYPFDFFLQEKRWLQKHTKNYLIIDKTIYHCGGDCILGHYFSCEEFLNDFHGGSYGSNLYELETTQKKIHAEYFWTSIFEDYEEPVKKCHVC